MSLLENSNQPKSSTHRTVRVEAELIVHDSEAMFDLPASIIDERPEIAVPLPQDSQAVESQDTIDEAPIEESVPHDCDPGSEPQKENASPAVAKINSVGGLEFKVESFSGNYLSLCKHFWTTAGKRVWLSNDWL